MTETENASIDKERAIVSQPPHSVREAFARHGVELEYAPWEQHFPTTHITDSGDVMDGVIPFLFSGETSAGIPVCGSFGVHVLFASSTGEWADQFDFALSMIDAEKEAARYCDASGDRDRRGYDLARIFFNEYIDCVLYAISDELHALAKGESN